MKKLLRTVSCILLILVAFEFSVDAQNSRWSEMRGKKIQTFDFNCAETKLFPTRSLRRKVLQAIPAVRREELGTWGNRAVVLRLINKKSPFYFVPLTCGATGNCSWRLYSIKPRKYLGELSGQYFYTYANSTDWPTIVTYTHMNVVEGILVTYRYRNGKYRQVGNEYAIDWRGSGTSYFDEKVKSHPMPKEFKNAKKLCEGYGG